MPMTREIDVRPVPREIRRRRAERPRSVADYLTADHRRLDAMMPAIEKAVALLHFDTARHLFLKFYQGLSRHIDVEEQVLFPAFEEMTETCGGGPTSFMQNEHVQIRSLMSDVWEALAAENLGDAGDAIEALVYVLAVHNKKEERIFYPMVDRAVGSEGARDDLVRRLRDF